MVHKIWDVSNRLGRKGLQGMRLDPLGELTISLPSVQKASCVTWTLCLTTARFPLTSGSCGWKSPCRLQGGCTQPEFRAPAASWPDALPEPLLLAATLSHPYPTAQGLGRQDLWAGPESNSPWTGQMSGLRDPSSLDAVQGQSALWGPAAEEAAPGQSSQVGVGSEGTELSQHG